ncbi:energy transducer TonB [Massilia sp. IC2-278]|uniref:energy transducer TonB n=1 Tax=Massilia sp. IC2-278 TaxID=2887200 RepID=UPI001E2FD8F5|nr:energy transducer TonB [Massilia sp. IC2-278]MCC2960536.1 energy transducer TonB [Massilia sp. IC2-278]
MHDRAGKWLLAAALAALALTGKAQTTEPSTPAGQSDNMADSVDKAPPLPLCRKPEYPAAEAKAGISGTSAISFLIDVDGRVLDTRVTKSSGNVNLDEAARTALAKCRFVPARENGKPFRSWQPVQYVWSLE